MTALSKVTSGTKTAPSEFIKETRDYGLKIIEQTTESVPIDQRRSYAIIHKAHGVVHAIGNQLSGALRAMDEMQKDLNLAVEGKDRELSPMEKAALLSMVQGNALQRSN